MIGSSEYLFRQGLFERLGLLEDGRMSRLFTRDFHIKICNYSLQGSFRDTLEKCPLITVLITLFWVFRYKFSGKSLFCSWAAKGSRECSIIHTVHECMMSLLQPCSSVCMESQSQELLWFKFSRIYTSLFLRLCMVAKSSDHLYFFIRLQTI